MEEDASMVCTMTIIHEKFKCDVTWCGQWTLL